MIILMLTILMYLVCKLTYIHVHMHNFIIHCIYNKNCACVHVCVVITHTCTCMHSCLLFMYVVVRTHVHPHTCTRTRTRTHTHRCAHPKALSPAALTLSIGTCTYYYNVPYTITYTHLICCTSFSMFARAQMYTHTH